MTVIYADSLLLVNFSMDFLSLYITAKLTHSGIYPIKIALSAALGAAWALMVTLLEIYINMLFGRILLLAANVLCAFIMSAVAFDERNISLIRTLTFIAVNIGLGGIMTAIYSFIGKISPTFTGDLSADGADPSATVFVISALIAGIVSLLYGKFRIHLTKQRYVNVSLGAFGREVSFSMLCDSGNLLREPFSDKPVVILSADRAVSVFPSELIDAANFPERITELMPELALKVRFICANSVTGKGILLCFVPDFIKIEEHTVEAVVAIDTNSNGYEGCDGIVPQILLTV